MNGHLESHFPILRGSGYRVTSPRTSSYNCIAWAASEVDRWWWPDEMEVYYWPPNVPRRATIQAFVLVFESLGYVPCEDASFDATHEKIAIYVAADGTPTHAARQLPDGHWTSKLGDLEDIVHGELGDLQGSIYGEVAVFLKRQLRGPAG